MENLNKSLSNSSENHSITGNWSLQYETQVASTVFLSILSISIIHGNTLVLRKCIALKAINEKGRLKNNAVFAKRISTIYMVSSICISDLLVGSICVPIWLMTELFLDVVEQKIILAAFLEFIDILIGISSISSVSLMNISRCCSIAFPLHSRRYYSIGLTKVGLFFTWTFSTVVAMLRFVNISRTKYVAFVSVVGFGMPLVLTILSCILAIRTIKERQRNQNLLQTAVKCEQNVGQTLLVISLLFFALWSPFFVVSFLYKYCAPCTRFFNFATTRPLITFIKWLHYSNSFANPWIIAHYNKQFQCTVNIPFLTKKQKESAVVS